MNTEWAFEGGQVLIGSPEIKMAIFVVEALEILAPMLFFWIMTCALREESHSISITEAPEILTSNFFVGMMIYNRAGQ